MHFGEVLHFSSKKSGFFASFETLVVCRDLILKFANDFENHEIYEIRLFFLVMAGFREVRKKLCSDT